MCHESAPLPGNEKSTSQAQVNTGTALAEIACLSSNNPQQAFQGLMHHFSVALLRPCFEKLDGQNALGVDWISCSSSNLS